MIINGFTSKASALRAVNAYLASINQPRISRLLAAPEGNPKVAKNGKVVDVLTAPLHLAPFDLSGFNVCPQASKGCAAACLHTAGNPAYMAQKERSRVAKTKAYFGAREAFMALLTFEIAAHQAKAHRKGMEPGVRLNATSDLPWEKRTVELWTPLAVGGVVTGKDHRIDTVGLLDMFPSVQFYDYTKVTKRALTFSRGDMPSNYHLTFSRCEDNDADCKRVLSAGGNVTVVMSRDVYKRTISQGRFWAYPAVDGDAHDYRPADGQGVVVALKAKGDARTDESGFVVR